MQMSENNDTIFGTPGLFTKFFGLSRHHVQILVGSFQRASAQDSAWRQSGYDAQRTSHNPNETHIHAGNVGDLEVAWTRSTPCSIRYYVSVVDGIAYYGHYCDDGYYL